MKNFAFLCRILATGGLLYLVYFETGPWTTVLLTWFWIRAELVDWWLFRRAPKAKAALPTEKHAEQLMEGQRGMQEALRGKMGRV